MEFNQEVCFSSVYPDAVVEMEQLNLFLHLNELDMDKDIEVFIAGYDFQGKIVACGAVSKGGIIKCVAIDPNYRGHQFSLVLATELINLAYELGYCRLFIYTKPENEIMFRQCGFYTIERVKNLIVLMENSPCGIQKYAEELKSRRKAGKKIGSIVMNANPFTLGHLYLIQTAASECDWLHLFLVKENASMFLFEERFCMVQENIKSIANVILHQGSEYIISRATFPCYFLKDEKIVKNCHMELDLKIFKKFIAPSLGITHRYVGREPYCLVTNTYNRKMREILSDESFDSPAIDFVEIIRKAYKGAPISASIVRKLIKNNEIRLLKSYLPEATYHFLLEHEYLTNKEKINA